VDALLGAALQLWRERRLGFTLLRARDEEGADILDGRRGGVGDDDDDAGERLLMDDEGSLEALDMLPPGKDDKLSVGETARLSLEFSMLWFAANYFASACLEYTSVGSVTILTSTSSIWTLIFCAVTKVEGFTVRKLVGVLASLVGVVLISSVDLSGANDDNRGSFPHKTTGQIAIGDAMAFFSAIIYGVYVTVMKRRVGNEDRVNMPLFFGLVGLFNVLFLWPGFLILHYTGIEPFELPPTASVWTIIAVSFMGNVTKGRLLTHLSLILPRPSSAIFCGHTPCCSRRRSSSRSACP
jgi:solute carrier family 35 protein F5